MPKLWGGRFSKSLDEAMEQFNASIPFDWQLWEADIQGSMAYARALARTGLISESERDQLLSGLAQIADEFAAGQFEIRLQDEDIHTAVEQRLGELVGDVAGKLHTGRSRNDQVATDTRLFTLAQIDTLINLLQDVQTAIIEQAERHLELVMPGYTHVQQAQPVLFSHWIMSFFWMLQRDMERLVQLHERTSVCPLGAGALAGNAFGLDREQVAADLGFAHVSPNSIDAVSDRDYIAEFLFWGALLQVHLSRLAEDLIIWSSREYGFVSLDDSFATGSSIMPQKRNPDSMELLRGKAGRLIGNLVGLLTTLKGIPSAYDKDLQEDKEPLFDTIETLNLALPVAAGAIRTMRVNAAAIEAALDDGLLATDLADYLVRKGIPFRQSHHLVGAAVKRGETLGLPLRDLPLSEYQAISDVFAADVYEVFSFGQAVALKNVTGGTAIEAVEKQIAQARSLLTQQGDAAS